MSLEKGVMHGMVLARALNAKVTAITVTEPLELGSGRARWIPPQEMFDNFGAARKERVGEVLGEVRAMAEQIGISVELLHVPNAHPATAINSKVQRLRLDRHGLSWASRHQEAIIGESNVRGSGGRKRTGVSSAIVAINGIAGELVVRG